VHQDYSLRAKDHKKKQTILKSLKQKAAERNEDEFYFGMVSRGKFSSGKLAAGKKWDGTVAGDRGNKALDMDTVRLLKTQDIGYLRTVRNVVAKEVRDLEQKAVVAGAFAGVDGEHEQDEEDVFDSDDDTAPRKAKLQSKPKKIVFAETEEELEEKMPEAEYSEDDDEDADVDMGDHGSEGFGNEKDREAKKKAQNVERLRKKLRNARKKLKALTDAENELELQRARMAKTATVASVTKRGQKIKIRERKR
jgi:U3 small nucleolar RNA-associated protein 11